MAQTTIENASAGYLLRCSGCEETFEINEKNALGQPLWVFIALCKGFGQEHEDCDDPEADEDHQVEQTGGKS